MNAVIRSWLTLELAKMLAGWRVAADEMFIGLEHSCGYTTPDHDLYDVPLLQLVGDAAAGAHSCEDYRRAWRVTCECTRGGAVYGLTMTRADAFTAAHSHAARFTGHRPQVRMVRRGR